MLQVPTLVLPGGEIMTESAAILIDVADRYPEASLAPMVTDPRRRQFLRWMVYVSSAIYSLHWIKPDVTRIGTPLELRQAVVDAIHKRIAFCWQQMDAQLTPGRYLLGEELTVLDLYVTVVSRFGPWRTRFYEVAPKMTPVYGALMLSQSSVTSGLSAFRSKRAGSDLHNNQYVFGNHAQPFH
jgi:GST-like protein